MGFEMQLLSGVILILVAGSGGAALNSYVSTVKNSADIQNLKERLDKLEVQVHE